MNNEKCYVCQNNLIKHSEESAIHQYKLVYQKCETCGPYGIYIDDIRRFGDLSEYQRKALLERAIKESPNSDTPIIKFK